MPYKAPGVYLKETDVNISPGFDKNDFYQKQMLRLKQAKETREMEQKLEDLGFGSEVIVEKPNEK